METDRYAVIGDPVKHSLSPVMHNATIKAMGIDADYSAIHVRPEDLGDFARRAKAELRGFNITVPHKKTIIPFLDAVSDECRLSESVNTVSITNGKMIGQSTDGYGLETGIMEAFGTVITGNRFCFIGCGGAAQAVAFYFAQKGASSLAFINRTLSKAESLAERLRAAFPTTEVRVCSPENETCAREFFQSAQITIQATSLGLRDEDPPPVRPELILGTGTAFYDTIYRETKLLKFCRENGIPTADGRTMLLHQGVKSLGIWTGQEVPVEVMREALYRAINERLTRTQT